MANVIQQLMIMLGADSTGLTNTLNQSQQQVSSWAGKVSGVLAGVSFGGLTVGALAAANKFDAAFVQIQKSTGATGEKLKGLEEAFGDVYKHTTASSEQVANALSILSTRTQATGKDLEDLTLKTIKLAKTQGEDVVHIVPLVTRAFGDWSIATNNQGKAMDYLRATSQQTGTQVSKLAEVVVSAGAPLRALGYDFNQAVSLIGKFEKEGVNTELVLGGMKAALQKFAKEGVTDTAAAWKDFVKKVQDGQLTISDVLKEVGAKRGVDLYKAIMEGRFQTQGLEADTEDLAKRGGENLETVKTKFTKIAREIETVVATHKDLVIGVGFALPVVQNLASAFGGLGATTIPTITNIATALRYGMGGALTVVETGIALLGGSLTAVFGILTGDFLLSKAANAGIGIGSAIAGGIRTGLLLQFPNLGGLFSTTTEWAGGKIEAAPLPPPHLAGEYIKGFKAPPGTGGPDDEKLKADFAALGIKDFQQQLSDAVKAFDELRAAGKLTGEQMLEVAGHIQKLRDEIANVRKVALDTSRATADFFRTGAAPLGVIGPANTQLHSASADLLQQLKDLPLVGDINELPASFDVASFAAQRLSEYLGDLANAQILADSNAQILAADFQRFGIRTIAGYEEQAKTAQAAYDRIKDSGMATADDLEKAWVQMEQAINDAARAGGKITEDEWKARAVNLKSVMDDIGQADSDRTQRQIKDTFDLGKETEAMGHRTFDSLEKGLASNLATWKGWGDTIKNVVTTLDTDLLSIMLKGFFKPLEDAFAKAAKDIGDWLGGLFKGTASAASTTAASGAGGAASAAGGAASAAAGGTLGLVGAIGSIGSMVAGVIGDIQNVRITNLLGEMEVTTRKIFAEVSNIRTDSWSQFNGIYGRLGEIWNSIKGLPTSGSTSVGSDEGSGILSSILSRLDTFVVPYMADMVDELRGDGIAGAGAGGGNIIITGPITVQANDPRQFFQALSRIARSQGVLGGVPNV